MTHDLNTSRASPAQGARGSWLGCTRPRPCAGAKSVWVAVRAATKIARGEIEPSAFGKLRAALVQQPLPLLPLPLQPLPLQPLPPPRQPPAASVRCMSALTCDCLAVLRDDANDDNFVKVARVGTERLLFFSDDDECTASMALPAEWQTRAVVESGHIVRSFFPPAQDYIGLFMVALALLPATVLAASEPRLLILGSGGGALAVLYARILPAAIIDLVEPSKACLTLGRRFFALRCRSRRAGCHRTHARAYVRRYRGPKYDLIVLDAFENDGHESATPRAWSRPEWCAELAAVLHPAHGILAANLFSADETTAPFRAHCDALWSGGSRAILQPGLVATDPTEESHGRAGAMAQTVEARDRSRTVGPVAAHPPAATAEPPARPLARRCGARWSVWAQAVRMKQHWRCCSAIPR